jgi:hypothetical protein
VIRSNAHGALEELREVIGVLRSVPAEDDRADGVPERPQPTLVDLPLLIDESRKAGMQVALECEVTDLGVVPEAVGRTAFRIVQEGLANASKHADHAAVSVDVRARRLTASPSRSATRGPWVSPALRRSRARVGASSGSPSGPLSLAGGWSTAAPRRVNSGCGHGCRGRRDRFGPGHRRR